MLPHPFNLRGYTATDPLDAAPTWARYLLGIGVGAAVSAGFLAVVFFVLDVATMRWSWLFWVEVGALALFYTPMVITLRKCSSLILMGLLVAVAFPLDLFMESMFRDNPDWIALWDYKPDGLLGPLPPLARFAVVWITDALVAGPLALWITRLLALAIWRKKVKPGAAVYRTEAYRQLFAEEWTCETIEKPKRGWAFWGLRLLGLGYVGYLVIVLLGAFGTSAWPDDIADLIKQSYENPALTINTFIKVSIMAALAFAGAYNRHLRFHAAAALTVGHAMSTVASLFFYFYDPPHTPYRDFLMASAIVDGVLIALFVAIMVKHRKDARRYKPDKEFPVTYSIAHRVTNYFFLGFGIVLAAIVFGVLGFRLLFDGESNWSAVYGFPDPQVCNTLTKYTTLSFLAFLMMKRERLREHFFGVITLAYVTSVIVSALWFWWGDMVGDVKVTTRSLARTDVGWYFMLNVTMDSGVLLAILGLRKMFHNVEYRISAVSPTSARAVMALHDALFGGDDDERNEREDDAAILSRVDAHVAGVRGRKRGLLNFPFWTLQGVWNLIFGLRAPFSVMDRAERRYFLRRAILRLPAERARSMIPPLANVAYQLGTAAHALIVLAEYTGVRAWRRIGYVPPDARDRLQADYSSGRAPGRSVPPPRGPDDPTNFRPVPAREGKRVAPCVVNLVGGEVIPREVDYLVVGSGAGGAVAAYRLAAAEVGSVLVVERGAHHSPTQDMNDREMEMLRKLYKEGGLQQTKRFDMMILQGECVGGTTVINNGVCFKMPDKMRATWTKEYDIDLSELEAEYNAVEEELGIRAITRDVINENAEKRFLRGVDDYNAAHPEGALSKKPLSVNALDPVGDGAWNLGNRGLRKRSMLETYLPWAQAHGATILPETMAIRFHRAAGSPTADAVTLRTRTGELHRVTVNKAIVVAGGVIASSHFLMRSGVAENVGRNVACNFALPIAVEFDEEIHAYDGLQITLAALDPKERAVFETYFNPPGSYAITVPFFFDRHTEFMNNYRKQLNLGALVGSEPNGRVEENPDWLNGRPVTWEIGDRDREHIRYALTTLLELARRAGGKRATLVMDPGLMIDLDVQSVEKFAKAIEVLHLEMHHLRLATAHPQGGNRMTGAKSDHKSTRVVDESFRVVGTDNVYVADASLFPTGITVNPQWTIWAMASLAAKSVLKQTSGG